MEEKSLKVYDTEKTFFSRITNTLNKILAPGKMGLNGMLISIKRNNVLKNYENYIQNEKNSDKKGMLLKKYEESYSLYLEAIKLNLPSPTWNFPLSCLNLTAAFLNGNVANLLGVK